mgnify:CR=1 FL=1
MEQKNQWIVNICTIKFDLEEGQMLEFMYPKNQAKALLNFFSLEEPCLGGCWVFQW